MRTLVSFHVDNTRVTNSNYAHGVYNIGVSTLFEHIVSTTYLHMRHLVILILSLMHVYSCTIEDMFFVVMLIS